MSDTVKTRIRNKFLNLSEYTSSWDNFVPLKGEVVNIFIPSTTSATNLTKLGLSASSEDRCYTKVGDNSHTIITLPWTSEPEAIPVSDIEALFT